MKVAVTGAAGFIGAHVARALGERGDQVIGIDNYNAYYDPRLKHARVAQVLGIGARVVALDVTDAQGLTELFRAEQPAAVIHLAAWAGVRPSRLHASLYAANNVVGTVNVFDACVKANVPAVIFASSSSVYGSKSPVPSPEEAAVDTPPSGYGVSKRAGELYGELFHHREGLHVTCLRFFTAYGPWYRPDMAVWKFTQRILRGEPVTLYVRDGGGTEVRRGFTEVSDIVRGVLAALDRKLPFAVINMGSQDSVSLRRLLGVIEAAVGRRARVVEAVLPDDEEVQTAADLNRARSLLAFTPSVPVEIGVPRFVAWYQDEFLRLFPHGLTSSSYWSP